MARLETWQLSYLIFPALIVLHLYVSPYTKVEESFNIQATHDILAYGVPTKNIYLRLKAQYDHMTFPGAVPRTFVGALLLASIARPFVWYGNLTGEQQQFLVRALLGLFNAFALIVYTSGVRQAYGKATAKWFVLLQASQFHIIYYSSRTLPNMFAFGISTIALRFLLPNPTSGLSQVKRTRLAFYLLTLATVVFRSELALLLASHGLFILFKSGSVTNSLTIIRTTFLPAVATATVVGLLLTVSVDTFFWQSKTLLWPELASFLSNIFPSADSLGASAWGTSPWYWYYTSAIPRLVLNPLLLMLIPYSLVTPVNSSIFDILAPPLIYTTLYSFLPHKETRFLFPIVPPLTAALAIIASHITRRLPRSSSTTATQLRHAILPGILTLSTILTFLLSHLLLLPLSSQTYPGGHALAHLHAHSLHSRPQPTLHVHLTNLALQTGVTHFLDHPSSASHTRSLFTFPGSADGRKPSLATRPRRTRWIYDKSDNATEFLTPAFWNQFDYVVVEDPARAIGAWDVVDTVSGLGKPRVLDPQTGRGTLVLGSKKERRLGDDGLARLAGTVYGETARFVYSVFHDLLREGYGASRIMGVVGRGEKGDAGWSWTRGWWLHWGLEPKLYILKRTESGIRPS